MSGEGDGGSSGGGDSDGAGGAGRGDIGAILDYLNRRSFGADGDYTSNGGYGGDDIGPVGSKVPAEDEHRHDILMRGLMASLGQYPSDPRRPGIRNAAPSDLEPYGGADAPPGSLFAFVGEEVDVYSGLPLGAEHPDPFTGVRASDPFAERQTRARSAGSPFAALRRPSLLSSPYLLADNSARLGGVVLSPEENKLGFDPLREIDDGPQSDFEKRLDTKQPFVQRIGAGNYVVRDGDVMRIRDNASGEISHYVFRAGETVLALDRQGAVLSSRGLEAPLETPIVDPIDVLFFAVDVAPLAAKGLIAGGRGVLGLAARDVIRQAEEKAATGTFRRTATEIAQELTGKYGGRLVDSDGALAQIIQRARNPALRVDGRAAANELRGILGLLEGGLGGRTAARVEVVPATNAGRTPDVVVHFFDGASTRYEMRALTSAPRGYVIPKPDLGRGALARSLAEATALRPVSESDVARAILDKAKSTPFRLSQLTAPLPGVGPGGTIAVNVTAASTNHAVVDGAVQRVASKLGAHVERIDVSFLLPRGAPSDPLLRGTVSYVRQPNGSYLRLP